MAVISKGFDWSKEYQKFEISRKGLMAIVLKGFDWVKGKGPMAIVPKKIERESTQRCCRHIKY